MIRAVQSLNLTNQRVLMRVDFNVPLKEGKVVDDFRIRAVLPTITYCLQQGGAVVLMSHLGRPGGERVDELSLAPVGEILCDHLEMAIKFSDDCISREALDVSRNLAPGEVHLLENLRFHRGETDNDPRFSKNLAQHGTVYVNDAFGTVHRAHASNVGVADHFTEKAMGLLMEKEYRFLHDVFHDPRRPLVIVLGGAKIGTKLSLIQRFLREADAILVGGAMAFTFLKAQGYPVGLSLVEDDMIGTARTILSQAQERSVLIDLPVDVLVTQDLQSGQGDGDRRSDEIGDGEMGVDIGKETTRAFQKVIETSNTVVWNGPMGVFEKSEFRRGTARIGMSVAKVSSKGGFSIIGGGDTAAAVMSLGLSEKMSHISTGGGASLQLLAGKDLPGFEALKGRL